VRVKEVYSKLTGEKGGLASLSIIDRDIPFCDNLKEPGQQNELRDEVLSKNILYDFKPPSKQYDFDINTRSGGEKAMAALALIFSMAVDLNPHPPHMILLDEVDAHLD